MSLELNEKQKLFESIHSILSKHLNSLNVSYVEHGDCFIIAEKKTKDKPLKIQIKVC